MQVFCFNDMLHSVWSTAVQGEFTKFGNKVRQDDYQIDENTYSKPRDHIIKIF